MKKIVILLLTVILAACSTPVAPTEQPVAAVVEPSATPIVVVQTVVVEATQAPTDVPPPTAVPPTAAPVVVVQTVVVQPTQAPAVVANTPASNGTISLDNTLGKGVFTNMTMSSNAFTLRCAPRDITFNITTTNQDIADAIFYYRVVDNKRLYPSEWKAFGKMVANGNGNFTLTFKGEDIAANLRLDNSWFDFQFVGLAKSGNVVDRTEKIQELVKYTFDCP